MGSPFIPTTFREASEAPVCQNRSNVNGIHQATAATIPILPSSQAVSDVNEQEWKYIKPRKNGKANMDRRAAYNDSHAGMKHKGDATKTKTMLKTSKEIPCAGYYEKLMN